MAMVDAQAFFDLWTEDRKLRVAEIHGYGRSKKRKGSNAAKLRYAFEVIRRSNAARTRA